MIKMITLMSITFIVGFMLPIIYRTKVTYKSMKKQLRLEANEYIFKEISEVYASLIMNITNTYMVMSDMLDVKDMMSKSAFIEYEKLVLSMETLFKDTSILYDKLVRFETKNTALSEEIKLIEEVNIQITAAVNKSKIMAEEYKQLVYRMEENYGNDN